MRKTFSVILKQVGEIFILQGGMVFLPFLVALIYREWYSAGGFLISSFLIGGIGWILLHIFRKADEPEFDHALLVAASGWLGIAIMGSIPFLLVAYVTPDNVVSGFIPEGADYENSSLINFKHPVHAFFESMSAYTTTGLTMTVHEPSVGKSVLFYRSVSQWVGGAGFIVMTLITFTEGSNRSRTLLYISESSGETLRRNIIDTAKLIWKLYLFLTLFSAVYLAIGSKIILPSLSYEEIIFNSVNHALTGQSTGGFTTLDNSIGGYNSRQMEILHILPMIMGAFSLSFYNRLFYKGEISAFWKDNQVRFLIISLIAGSIVLSLLLMRSGKSDASFHEGIFQFVSSLTTTGWQTTNVDNWDYISILVVVAAMFVGGSAGATTGGIKVIRVIEIFRELRWQINKTFLSGQTIKEIQSEGGKEQAGERRGEFIKAATLAIMFFLIVFASSVLTYLFTGSEYNYSTSLFEAASAQGTVGLTAGIVSPSMPAGLEIIYIFQMWTGRLEIIPVIAFFRVLFFGTAPRAIKF